MKKSILLLIALSASVAGWSQTTQGSFTFGGGARYTTNKNSYDTNYKNNELSLQPSVGYFVADNLVAGVTLSFTSNKTSYGNGDNTTNQTVVGPFARYYKFTSNDRFAFTGEVGFLFGGNKYKPDIGNDTKGSSFNFYIAPGFTYYLNEKWGLDLQLRGITYTKNDPNKDVDNDDSSSFSFGLQSFSPSLGFRYYMSK